jgi:hypothetical protein
MACADFTRDVFRVDSCGLSSFSVDIGYRSAATLALIPERDALAMRGRAQASAHALGFLHYGSG